MLTVPTPKHLDRARVFPRGLRNALDAPKAHPEKVKRGHGRSMSENTLMTGGPVCRSWALKGPNKFVSGGHSGRRELLLVIVSRRNFGEEANKGHKRLMKLLLIVAAAVGLIATVVASKAALGWTFNESVQHYGGPIRGPLLDEDGIGRTFYLFKVKSCSITPLEAHKLDHYLCSTPRTAA